MSNYEVKGKTTKIVGTSRCAIKVKDNYYTVELSAERALPDEEGVIIDEEYKALFNSINTEVDRQMQEILDTFK